MPKNLPFTATPADAFLVHKHKSGSPLRSTASWKCPVAVRRNTAIPDGDTSAPGAGLTAPPEKREIGGINAQTIKIKTEITIRMKIKSGIKTGIRI